jgi:hypothetical protein
LAAAAYRDVLMAAYQHSPDKFWHWSLPYNIAIKIGFLALFFARGRPANITALGAVLLLFFVPYWHH